MSADTLTTYAARIERARAGLQAALQGVLQGTMRDGEDVARRLASSRFRARGDMLSAIRGRVDGLEARLSGDTSRAPGVRLQEEGGIVRARRGPWLTIPASNGHGWVRVHQVSIRPKWFIRDAMASVVPGFREAARLRVAELVTRGQ